MSRAKPMGNRRALAYIAQRPDAEFFTHAQARRMSHKSAREANRPVPGWKPRNAKGRPTPRQRRPKAAS